jgi:hypothetical protein
VESVSRLIAKFNAQDPVSIVGLQDREYLISLVSKGAAAS